MSQENSVVFEEISEHHQEKSKKELCSWMIARTNDLKPFFDPQKLGTTRRFGLIVFTPQQKQQRFQEERYVAFSFIENGADYDSILAEYPHMPVLAYNSHLNTIHKNIINDIYCYLHIELALEDVQQISYDEMHDIYNQLLDIKNWLGYFDVYQLEAYYTFIRRRYDRTVFVDQNEAGKLYKTISKIAKKTDDEQMQEQEEVAVDVMDLEMWSQLQFD